MIRLQQVVRNSYFVHGKTSFRGSLFVGASSPHPTEAKLGRQGAGKKIAPAPSANSTTTIYLYDDDDDDEAEL